MICYQKKHNKGIDSDRSDILYMLVKENISEDMAQNN